MLTLYPAIDLKEGRCVRLAEGRMETATIFNEDPAEQAALFQAAGFSWLHIVDLDGAMSGEPRNAGVIARILARANVPVQIGGGVRRMQSVHYWLEAGAARVILGTAAVRDPTFAREAARAFPGRIVISLDARDGRIAVEGWAEQTDLEAAAFARQLEDAGVAALVVTDIAALKAWPGRPIHGVILGRALYDGAVTAAEALAAA